MLSKDPLAGGISVLSLFLAKMFLPGLINVISSFTSPLIWLDLNCVHYLTIGALDNASKASDSSDTTF